MKLTNLLLSIVLIGLLAGCTQFPMENIDASPSPATTNAAMLTEPTGTEVKIEEVEYTDGVTGFYATPQAKGSYPGVVMIHEWWGLNDHIKDMAKQLASQGYQVLAVDLYSGKVATTPDEARGLTQSLDKTAAISNLQDAVQHLKDQGATKVASLGWCFGGGQSLQLALSGTPLDATVIYYGNLVTNKDQLGKIDWPLLGIFGAEDQSIPVTTVQEFEKNLGELGKNKSITIYPGVGHAFANPSGQSYAPQETQDAWRKTLAFLEDHLKS